MTSLNIRKINIESYKPGSSVLKNKKNANFCKNINGKDNNIGS